MNMEKIAVGIILLLLATSVSPLVIGDTSQPTTIISGLDDELAQELDNLRYLSNSPYDFDKIKYEYHKQEPLPHTDEGDTSSFKSVESVINNEPLSPLDGLMNSSWPMKSHDLRHTGQSPYSTADVDGLEKWSFTTDKWVDGSIAIDDDGILYFGDWGWDFHAVYPNGTEKWRYRLDSIILSAPAIAEDGTIYCTSYDDFLYAFHPNGTIKWRHCAGGSISSSPAIVDDGTIYLGTMGPGNNGRIIAVNPNGTRKWHYETDYLIESDPAVGDDGTVYIGGGDSYLYAMNPNGTLKWRFDTGDEIHGHPSIADDGTIYIGSNDDYLYAINPDGSEKWRCNTRWGVNNNVAIGEDGTIYAGTDKLYAINPDNGSKIWALELGGQHWISESSPAISLDGTIYVGTSIGDINGGDILAVNPDGTLSWRKRIATYWIDSSPVIGPDGTVYIGTAYDVYRGYIHAFGPVTSNEPPHTPTIDGPTEGIINQDYRYYMKSFDPDNNPVSFFIDWGDGTTPSWSMDFASDDFARIWHNWDEVGNFTIRVKARDTLGEETDWAYLEVSMPMNQQVQFPFISWLLERFPNSFPILRQLFEL